MDSFTARMLYLAEGSPILCFYRGSSVFIRVPLLFHIQLGVPLFHVIGTQQGQEVCALDHTIEENLRPCSASMTEWLTTFVANLWLHLHDRLILKFSGWKLFKASAIFQEASKMFCNAQGFSYRSAQCADQNFFESLDRARFLRKSGQQNVLT